MDFMHIKQALLNYLAEKNPRCQNTFFNNETMDLILPYLKQLTPLWDDLTPLHLNTSYPAISSYYHSLRGHLKNRARLS